MENLFINIINILLFANVCFLFVFYVYMIKEKLSLRYLKKLFKGGI